ncbi:MAG: gliding motility-associated protein GldE, partial [Lutibacter sp.]|nr:gliding motility-associated protein GldE [Lutibacter sp.]
AELFEENKGESETIAGFILEVCGRFPRKDEIIKFADYSFKIESMDKKRIKKVKINISRNT